MDCSDQYEILDIADQIDIIINKILYPTKPIHHCDLYNYQREIEYNTDRLRSLILVV